MRVSALIPTYNRRAQVLRAIDSVLAQTVPVDEIIVVDDGSTDGTAEAIHSRYASRVTLFRQENAGVSAARNRGIREARGEWIAFLDSDDVWLPTKIECQIEALGAFGDQFGVCFTDNLFDGDPNRKLAVFQEAGFEVAARFGPLDDPASRIVAAREPFFTSSLLVRRCLVEEVGGLDEALTIAEDADLVFRLSFKTKFCFVAEPLVRIDRAPSRMQRLTDLYSQRVDRKYDNLRRVYAKWSGMAEVVGTRYERPVRERLQALHYDSAECKIHQLRVGAALREIGRLRVMGVSYPSVALNLLSRKIGKLWRRFVRSLG